MSAAWAIPKREGWPRPTVLRLDLDASTSLVQLGASDAEDLYLRVATERDRLAEWLPWASSSTMDSTRAFCADSLRRCERGEGFDLAIWHEGNLVGVVGAQHIDALNRTASLGYWLSAEAQGRGLMTRACAAALDHCFGPMQLHRVEIRVAPANLRSLAVVRRLGAREEGVAREAALLQGRHHDLAIYGVLAREWAARGSASAREG